MEFWAIFGIGLVITLITSIIIHREIRINKVLLYVLIALCVCLVGGIANAKWIGVFAHAKIENTFFDYFGMAFITIIPAILTWFVGYGIMGIYLLELKNIVKSCFFIIFILSIIGWSIPICKYNRNIEKFSENVVVQKQENDLLYFCNIPVQKISGNIDGGSFLGTGHVDGNIATSDELPYWYLNKYGEGEYDSVLASEARIIFIENDEKPYVKCVTYRNQTVTKNHNNGKEKIEYLDGNFKIYYFYLPKEIMQYNIG